MGGSNLITPITPSTLPQLQLQHCHIYNTLWEVMFGVGYWLLIKRCQLVLVKGQTRRITQEWVVAVSMLAYIQTPPQPEASGRDPSGAITCCLMMEEHVSFPGWDTLSELPVEFTVKPCEGQWRIEHTAKNVGQSSVCKYFKRQRTNQCICSVNYNVYS